MDRASLHALTARVPTRDEAAMAEIDYATLRRYLLAPAHRIGGVEYELLGQLIEAQSLSQLDFVWARELANVHAFLSEWDP